MHHVIDWYDGRGCGCRLLDSWSKMHHVIDWYDGCIRVWCDLRDSVGVRVSVRVSRVARFAAGQAGGISRIETLKHLEN